jgi:hypothetical protein
MREKENPVQIDYFTLVTLNNQTHTHTHTHKTKQNQIKLVRRQYTTAGQMRHFSKLKCYDKQLQGSLFSYLGPGVVGRELGYSN